MTTENTINNQIKLYLALAALMMGMFFTIGAIMQAYDLTGTHAHKRHGSDAALALDWIESNKGPNSCRTCENDGRYRCFVPMNGSMWAVSVEAINEGAKRLITAFSTDDQAYVQDERKECGFQTYAHP